MFFVAAKKEAFKQGQRKCGAIDASVKPAQKLDKNAVQLPFQLVTALTALHFIAFNIL